MNIIQEWQQKLDWLTLPTLNHHLLHICAATALFWLLTYHGVTENIAIRDVFILALIAETLGKLTGETWWSCASDLFQYSFYVPIVWLHQGDIALAVIGWLVIIPGYIWTTTQQ